MHEYLAIPFIDYGIPVVVVPMFDGIGGYTKDFWSELKGVGVLNFSGLTHAYFSLMGFDSLRIQYFPELSESFDRNRSGNKIAKFWHRSPEFNPNQVSQKFLPLFDRIDVRLGGQDENISLVDPTKSDRIRFFELPFNQDPSEYLSWLSGGSFFIAPRLYEGIGLSVLEAMSIGLIPIVHNSPVMTEYVKSGFNGIVVDYRNNKPLDELPVITRTLSNIEKSFKNGHRKFVRDLPRVERFLSSRAIKFQHKRSSTKDSFLKYNFWLEANGRGVSKLTPSYLAKFPINYYAYKYNL
jgi:hypothetical protein